MALCVLTACGDTAVVVTVRGDLAIPDELDALCLSVHDADDAGGEFARLYRLGDEVSSLPQTLTVFPGDAERGVVAVRGYRAGIEVARDRKAFEFSGGVDDLSVRLDACREHAAGAPAVEASANVPDAARAAVSFGRGGTVIAVVSADAATVYDASLTALDSLPQVDAADVLAFDADGDCDDDLAIVPVVGPPTLALRAGRSFTEAADAFAGAPQVALARAADVDGDGDQDVVLAGGATLVLARNDGNGRFQVDAAAIPGGAVTDATALGLGDLDGDGNVDIVVGQGAAADAPARVLFNDPSGAGFFELAAAALPDVPLDARDVAVVDANGDGAADVLVAVAGGALRAFVNRGDGRLEDRSFVTLPAGGAVDAASVSGADWDGDCLLDVIVGFAAASPVGWRGSDTGALFAEALPELAGSRVALADIDDDGARDLLVVGAGTMVWVKR